MLVLRADAERVLAFRPTEAAPATLSVKEFSRTFSGHVFLARPAAEPVEHDDPGYVGRKFGFGWFVPELLKYRSIWRDVLLASLAIQLMALATPLFTQVVIDKVVVHHTLNTLAPSKHYRRLYALCLGFVALGIALARGIPDSLYLRSPSIRHFADSAARIIPSIDQFAAVSDFPGTTKVALACLWALVPPLALLMVVIPNVLLLRAEAIEQVGWRVLLIVPVLLCFAVLLPVTLKIGPDDLHSGLAVDKYIWLVSNSKIGLGIVSSLYCFVASFCLAAVFIIAREFLKGGNAARPDITG